MISVPSKERLQRSTIDSPKGTPLIGWLRIDLIKIDPFRNEMEPFVLEMIEKNGRVNL